MSSNLGLLDGSTRLKDILHCSKMQEIPAHTTSRIQPLNVYFNRQWKVFARRIFDHVQFDDIAINLSERNNIIQLNSLIHNRTYDQVCIRVYWSGCKSVNEVCLNIGADVCQHSSYHSLCFIQCSHCQKLLFFEGYHYHK